MNNGKICVSVCAQTAERMIENIIRAEEFADVIEVRFDCLERGEIKRVFESLPATDKTYLFTFRPKEAGGMADSTFGERLKFWELAFWSRKSNFMIDIESDPRMVLAVDPHAVERIVSLHDYKGVPDNLDATWEMTAAFSRGTVKIAVLADDAADAMPVWKLLNLAKFKSQQIIPIAMGEAGKWTRILGLAHGACMTYASLETGGETAPGQITAEDLIEIYRVRELDEGTKVYGVIGDPVSESLSPFIHNPVFASLSINAVLIPLLVKNLDEFITRMVRSATREIELNFAGFSVTMPHKQSIISHLDAIDPTAEKIGAVNTVKIDDAGKLTGYNTDAHGFITPLKEKFGELRDARVAVFGAGGAARACVYALKQEGAKVTIFARDRHKTDLLGSEFSVEAATLPNTENRKPKAFLADFDIVVNATPLGMKGPHENESLFTAEELKGVKFVYDLVTRSDDTPIIEEAKKANIPAMGGLEMLVAQGAKQFEIWTGMAAPVREMKAAAIKRIRE